MSNKSDGKPRFFPLKPVVRVLAVAILFFLGSRGVNAADPQNSNIERDLIRLEDQWDEAIVKVDFSFMDSMLADDYVCTTVDGSVLGKAQYFAYEKQLIHNFTLKNDDYRVKVYGNTAVITYRENLKEPGNNYQFRETDVWIKKGGQWKIVASHESKITG